MSDHDAKAQANATIATKALKELFADRDVSAIDRYFVKSGYTQHNPAIPNGTDALRGLIPNLASDFKYEQGMVVSQGDIVMVHTRYTGWGPKPMVAVDIFRIEDGKIAEHWDVMQEEVAAEQSRNGNPMFRATATK
jgi:predicted SnoaL-like aldol condensation-catalyzing enzyme